MTTSSTNLNPQALIAEARSYVGLDEYGGAGLIRDLADALEATLIQAVDDEHGFDYREAFDDIADLLPETELDDLPNVALVEMFVKRWAPVAESWGEFLCADDYEENVPLVLSDGEHGTLTLTAVTPAPASTDDRDVHELMSEAWVGYLTEHGFATMGGIESTGADFGSGFERGYAAGFVRGDVAKAEALRTERDAALAVIEKVKRVAESYIEHDLTYMLKSPLREALATAPTLALADRDARILEEAADEYPYLSASASFTADWLRARAADYRAAAQKEVTDV